MSIFVKKKKGNLTPLGFSGGRVSRLSRTLEKKKRILAAFLDKKINGYSAAQKKTGLLLFCIFFSSLSIYQLEHSFHGLLFSSPPPGILHIGSSFPGGRSPSLTASGSFQYQKNKIGLDSLRIQDSTALKDVLLINPLLTKIPLQPEYSYPPQIK
jgi:hypothetical protein